MPKKPKKPKPIAVPQKKLNLPDDEPLFGIERRGMRIEYTFGKNNEVRSVALGVPYAMREQLLGQLMSMFGRYWEHTADPIANHYYWPVDERVGIAVRASRDPKNGILEFWVMAIPPPDLER